MAILAKSKSMGAKAFSSGGFLLLALPLVLVGALFSQHSSVGQLSADQILKTTSATYQDAQSYRFVAQKNVEVATVGEIHSADGSRTHSNFHQSTIYEITLAAAAPAKARLTVKDEKQEVLAVSDGHTTWTYMPSKKQYAEERVAAPNAGKPTESMERSEPNLLSEFENLLVNRFRNLSIYGSSAKLEKESKMKVGADKVDCYVLKIETQGGSHELWVDKERYIIWRSIDSTPTPQEGIILQTVVTVTLREADMNAKLEDSLFTFTPPEKAKKVESIKGISRKGS